MKRFSAQPYLLTFLFLFALLSLSPKWVNPARVQCMSILAKPWQSLQILKSGFSPTFAKSSSFKDSETEVKLLKQSLAKMEQWAAEETRFHELLEKYPLLVKQSQKDSQGFYQRRAQEMARLIELHTHAVMGKVIYRDPALWSSFVWLGLGEETNQNLESVVIAKNSPVLSNGCLVGIVEEVYQECCKVRLITDKRLNPSVRALRGSTQEQFHQENIDILLSFLENSTSIFHSEEESRGFLNTLRSIKERIKPSSLCHFLAKGELHGMSEPLWRTSGTTLYGIGFNYDFADGEGPSRNLRTGEAEPFVKSMERVALLNPADLLVTTGLDGIFPAGLPVAVVTKIYPLTEGSSSYSLEAKACQSHLNSLEWMTIIPPLSQELPLEG